MRIVLSGDRLSLEEVGAVARGGARVEIAAAARQRVRAARALVERIAEGGVPTYGINTGFGTLAEVSIPRGDLRKLQRNLVLSHSAGTGAALPPPEGPPGAARGSRRRSAAVPWCPSARSRRAR